MFSVEIKNVIGLWNGQYSFISWDSGEDEMKMEILEKEKKVSLNFPSLQGGSISLSALKYINTRR
jgi:hypothetical protein